MSSPVSTTAANLSFALSSCSNMVINNKQMRVNNSGRVLDHQVPASTPTVAASTQCVKEAWLVSATMPVGPSRWLRATLLNLEGDVGLLLQLTSNLQPDC